MGNLNYKTRVGLIGEYITIFIYLIRFYKLVKHRYKSKLGEIDIIAQKGDKIVFIEVKTRLRSFDIDKLVSFEQKNRIKRSAMKFLASNPQYKLCSARIDTVIIRLGKPIIIENSW